MRAADPLGDPLPVLLAAHVETMILGAIAEACRGGAALVVVDVREQHVRALGVETRRDGAPDTARGARDECDAPIESPHG